MEQHIEMQIWDESGMGLDSPVYICTLSFPTAAAARSSAVKREHPLAAWLRPWQRGDEWHTGNTMYQLVHAYFLE